MEYTSIPALKVYFRLFEACLIKHNYPEENEENTFTKLYCGFNLH
jgi:hypothetical protein